MSYYATEDHFSGRPPFFFYQKEHRAAKNAEFLPKLLAENEESGILIDDLESFQKTDEFVSTVNKALREGFRKLSVEEKEVYLALQQADRVRQIEDAIAMGQMLPTEKYGKAFLRDGAACCGKDGTSSSIAAPFSSSACFVSKETEEEYG